MDRLGYQGGDWGSAITTAIGAQDAEHCAGIHVTLAMSTRPNVEGQGDRRTGAKVDGSELHEYPALERDAEGRSLRGVRAAGPVRAGGAGFLQDGAQTACFVINSAPSRPFSTHPGNRGPN
jgi:hypothetical protein